jgi:hypothetical protein
MRAKYPFKFIGAFSIGGVVGRRSPKQPVEIWTVKSASESFHLSARILESRMSFFRQVAWGAAGTRS